MALALELGTQVAEVVDLAVVRERQARDLVAHRLLPAARVDDREPAVAEEHAPPVRSRELARPITIRPAMRDGVEHPPHRPRRDRTGSGDDGSGDAAHS